jgi:hypothetical protein
VLLHAILSSSPEIFQAEGQVSFVKYKSKNRSGKENNDELHARTHIPSYNKS